MCPIWIKQTMCHKASSDHGWLFSYRFSCYPLETKGNLNTEGFSVLPGRSHSISAGCRRGGLIFPPLLGASSPSTMGTMALAHLYVCQRCPQALCCLCHSPVLSPSFALLKENLPLPISIGSAENTENSPSSKPGSDTKKKPPNEILCRVGQEALELGDGGSHLGSLASLHDFPSGTFLLAAVCFILRMGVLY